MFFYKVQFIKIYILESSSISFIFVPYWIQLKNITYVFKNARLLLRRIIQINYTLKITMPTMKKESRNSVPKEGSSEILHFTNNEQLL